MGSAAHNPDPSSTPAPVQDEAGLTNLSVRLWSINPQDAHWSSAHAGICLIADLLTASGGQLVGDPQVALTVQFDCPERALNAARRLQRALYTFTEGQDTSGFGAAVVIHRPEADLRRRSMLAVPDLLFWEHAAPGQILVSSDAHEVLQSVPGLEFRSVARDETSYDLAYQELLWIDPEVLGAWQGRVVAASQKVLLLDPDTGSVTTVLEFEAQLPSATVSTVPDHNGENRDGSLWSHPVGRKRLWIAAVVVIVVIATLGVVLIGKKSGKRSTTTGIETKISVPQPTPPRDGATNVQPIPKNEDKVTEQVKPMSGEPPPPPPNPHKAPRESETAVGEYEGFTARQIPQLLRKAEEDAGAGNYGSAKREYEIALKLQPGNTTARDGLRKLALKINEHR